MTVRCVLSHLYAPIVPAPNGHEGNGKVTSASDHMDTVEKTRAPQECPHKAGLNALREPGLGLAELGAHDLGKLGGDLGGSGLVLGLGHHAYERLGT